jgi:hypothetical protein
MPISCTVCIWHEYRSQCCALSSQLWMRSQAVTGGFAVLRLNLLRSETLDIQRQETKPLSHHLCAQDRQSPGVTLWLVAQGARWSAELSQELCPRGFLLATSHSGATSHDTASEIIKG